MPICVDSIKNARNWDEIRLFLLDDKKNLFIKRNSEKKKKKYTKVEKKELFEKKEEMISEEKDQKNGKKTDQKDLKKDKNYQKKELFKRNDEKVEKKEEIIEQFVQKIDFKKKKKQFKAFKPTKSQLEKKKEPLSLLKISEELRRKIKTNDSNTEIPPLIHNLKRKRPQTSFFHHKKKVLLCKERIKQEPIEDNSKERTFITSSSLKEEKNKKKYLVGSLLENDVPDHIITNTLYDIVNKTPPEKRLFLIDWKKREKGGKPQNSYCRGEDLKERFPLILLDYYENNAVFQ